MLIVATLDESTCQAPYSRVRVLSVVDYFLVVDSGYRSSRIATCQGHNRANLALSSTFHLFVRFPASTKNMISNYFYRKKRKHGSVDGLGLPLAYERCPITEPELTDVGRLVELDLVVQRPNGHRVDIGLAWIGHEAGVDGIVDDNQTVGTYQPKADVVIIHVVRLGNTEVIRRPARSTKSNLIAVDEDKIETVLSEFN